jgi:hypothetical protein
MYANFLKPDNKLFYHIIDIFFVMPQCRIMMDNFILSHKVLGAGNAPLPLTLFMG